MKKVFMSFLCVCSIGLTNAMDPKIQNMLAKHLIQCVKENLSSKTALEGYLELMQNKVCLPRDEAEFHMQYQTVQMFYEYLQKMEQTKHDKRKKSAKINR